MHPSDSPTPSEPKSSSANRGTVKNSCSTPDVSTSEALPANPLRWTTGDRWFAIGASALIFALSLIHWGRTALRGAPSVDIQRLTTEENRFQLDINDATWVEWMQLSGVGETLARRIVEDRVQNGPFSEIDEIQRIHGIGPKTVEQLRPWLSCADCPSFSPVDDGDRR